MGGLHGCSADTCVRFYFDENLPRSFALAARRLGVDATTSAEAARNGTSDAEQLRWAATLGRCIVTRDRRDFTRLATEFRALDLSHVGVLLIPGSFPDTDVGGFARALAAYADAHPEDRLVYDIDWLTRDA